jgi:hypothetical protein
MLNKLRILAAISLSLIFVFFWSCDETTEFTQGQLFSPAVQGELAKDTLYAELDTTFSIPIPSTRSSNRLLVGSFEGFNCRPIIRFRGLPQNATIFDARIRFITAGLTGDNPQSFTMTAYPILNDWDSNVEDVWDNYQTNIDTTTVLGSMEVTTVEDDTLIMQMDSVGIKFFNTWTKEDSAEFNYGFILNFNNANFIKEFYSNSNLTGPGAILTYAQPQDTTKVDTFLSSVDAYLIEGNLSRQPDRDYVISLNPWVTLLQFNTSYFLDENKFPNGVIVESANLQLGLDRQNSHFNAALGANTHILRLESELNDSQVEIDSSVFGSATFSIDVSQFLEDSNVGSERRDLGHYFLQDQLENPEPVKKLFVGFTNNIDGLSYFVVFKRDHPNRPRLIIEYWIPPGPRYN